MAKNKDKNKRDDLIDNPSRKMQAEKNRQIDSKTREQVIDESKYPLE